MQTWGTMAACTGLYLALPCAADESPKSYAEEVAERAALTALLKSQPISIVGLVRGPDSSSAPAGMFEETCRSWEMAATDIVEFFKTGHAMPGEEWHYEYAVLPCAYRGVLQVGSRDFKFTLNLGSYAHIRDTAQAGYGHFYGCPEPCRHLFPPSVQWTDQGDR